MKLITELISAVFFVLLIVYAIYVASGNTPCEKGYRAASPVRIVSNIARSGFWNWTDSTQRIDMLVWGKDVEVAVSDFIVHEFYGEQIRCSH